MKLRIGDHFIEDVTDVLKRFFREVDDPIFMADLHPLWQEAASESRSSLDLQELVGALMLTVATHTQIKAHSMCPCVCVCSEIRRRSLRLERYKDIIRNLPRVNRTTLAALISHLYR